VTNSPATSLVLTLLGPDRPGLVERVSQVLIDNGGNWVESRMAHLAGQFAGILRVELPRDRTSAFKSACRTLGTEGLQVLLVEAQESPKDVPLRRMLRLELIGHDRPGIVREISQALAHQGINVEELQTGVESAPMSAEMLFFAKALLAVPVDLSTEGLARQLESIGNDLTVDITLLPSE
jgi:glycine cleavage system regulatory protein